jgi:hypothetical protein
MEVEKISNVGVPAPNTDYLDIFKCSNILCLIALITKKVSEEQQEEMKNKEKKYLSEVFMKDIMKYVKEKEGSDSVKDHYALEGFLERLLKNDGQHGDTFESSLALEKFQAVYNELKTLDKKYKKPSKEFQEKIMKATKPIRDMQGDFSELSEKDGVTLDSIQGDWQRAIDQLVAEYNKN